jgi:hypothetical protein
LPLAATALGLSEELIEKDFWVVEILRVLQEPPDGITVIFKGGTSLSKGFQLIKRMSEDIDILLLSQDLTGRQRDQALQAITDKVAAHLGLDRTQERMENGRKMVTRFSYGERSMLVGSPGVLLELGFRGHPEPSRSVGMTSYIADYIATRDDKETIVFEELEPIRLDLLAPERTLLEKIFALHVAATNFANGSEEFARLARYYYDVKMLLDNNEVCGAIPLLGDMQAYSETELLNAGIGGSFTGPSRPYGGYAQSPAFEPSEEMMPVLQPAYDAAMRFVFLNEAKPTLGDCLSTVRAKAALL